MVCDTSLFNTQNYKVLSEVKLSNPNKILRLLQHLGVVVIENRAFG